MRTVVIALAVAVLGLAAAFFSGLIDFGGTQTSSGNEAVQTASAAGCAKDAEIAAAERDGATAAAQAFYTALLKSDDTAFDAMTDEAKKLVAKTQFQTMMRTIVGNGPYEGLAIENTYKPTVVGDPARSPCDTLAVSALPKTTQIHTLFNAHTRNNDWSLSAWMIEENKTWRVHAFYVAPSSIVGLGPDELFAMAEDQAKKGNAFNAYMLYVTAKGTADRGPNIDLDVTKSIEAALAKQTPPDELKGAPPFNWKIGRETFPVEFVAVVGTDKRLGLMFLHRDPAWDGKDTGKGERRNKRLIDGFVKAHPSYKDVFAYVVARILEPGKDTGWGTVYDAAKGYDTGEPSIGKKTKTN